MLTPTVANRLSFLYAIGNTPATSLTRSVPIGKDVDILSLGCGDVRNILFTSYVERGLAKRKIDVTCCDYDEKVIARNILFLTLLLDSPGRVAPSCLWDIYYHLYVDDATVEEVLKHVRKLLPLLESLQTWKHGPYANIIRVSDQATLEDVRSVCRRILHGAEQRNTASYAAAFKKNLKKTSETLEAFSGKTAFETYSTHGTVTPHHAENTVPNPMFASLVSQMDVLHYGSDPTLGYHLAVAFAPLSENSPLAMDHEKTEYKTAEAARAQFTEWIAAFRELASRGMVVRFMVADVFACCHTLQHSASTGKPSGNWYRRQWDLRPLELDSDEYGPAGKGPTAFDVVDSSNLSDHVGALNIIVAASSLLKTEPWATLYTESLLKRGKSQKEAFEKLLCGNITTVLLLLGISPVQYWTNAKCESHVDEIFLTVIAGTMRAPQAQIHSRLAWKRDDQLSGTLGGRGKLHIDASALVRILFDMYMRMFSGEDYKISASTALERSSAYTHFHRGTFASFLKVVKHRVRTDWPAVCSQLFNKISQDRTLALSTNQLQELGIQMHLQDVSTESWLLRDSDSLSNGGRFRTWKNVPLAVAVTGKNREKASPTFVGSLRAGPNSPNQWQNMYSDVHIVFGKVENSPKDENTPLVVERDDQGWSGSSALIASFVVPTAALQVDPVDARVAICIPPSAQAAYLYMGMLGFEMTVFETKLSAASSVFVTKLMPGLSGHKSVCSGVENFGDVVDDAGNGTSSKIMAEVPASESKITTVTGHVDILSDKGKKMLQDKVPIQLQQRDPFVIDVIFGNNALTGSRSRVARKSGYIEVVARVASSKDSVILSDFIYPTRLDGQGFPAALNASHMNLDALPVLDLEKKDQMQWLVTLASLEFSPREKKMRDEADKKSGISENLRVNFKESLLTMFMLTSGLQGGQTGMFAINHPEKGGIHMLILVSALKLDADCSSVVLDAAVIPMTNQLVSSGSMEPFLVLIRTLECCSINVNDAELILWKRVLPALAERCRTWSHRSDCEYKRRGATVPLSLVPGEKVLCSCGNGKLPKNFISVPEWETAAPNAVRIAISPTFSVPLVEDVVDPGDMAKGKGQLAAGDRCRSCGTAAAKDGGSLKKCMRCQVVKYCSTECQKEDWKKHRMECMDVDG
ncbi:MYND finger family protein [Metarhizium acridum CQMa 102]|uniref:MYND finger family protein n=1 Tax=Metarhizium acridum (strain CQMa 102) TaxID=655827 RepID=E9E455_METAQ|nr:MYND finger family protein [Metarhizium acridum CQMa 102]EFY89272.1 MYND finger family protein [Metarhizium acridum CQMa 102]